jgi:hypothetical protein
MKPKLFTRLLAFLEPHRVLITLLGTLILFLTFISRDVLREWARTKRDKFENAHASFNLNKSITDLNDSIHHLGFFLLSEKPNSEDPNKQRHAHWEIAHECIDYLEPLIKNVYDLCQTLPSETKKEQDQLRFFSSRSKELGDRLGKEPPGEASDQLMKDVFTEEEDIRDTGQSVIKSLENEAEYAEGWEGVFNGCSLVLYPLGIVFTVTGQLLGAKIDTSGS